MPINPLFFADLIRENSNATGTGPMSLSGAPPGYRPFAGNVPADTDFHYCIAGVTQPAEWETGVGTIGSNGQLQRKTVLASSANGAKTDFSSGTKTISLTVAAEWFDDVQDAVGGGSGGLVLQVPPLDNGAASLRAIDMVPPGGMTNGAGGNDGVNSVFQVVTGEWINGPTGQTSYYDSVAGWGMNCRTDWRALNTALPAVSDRYESKFAQGGASDPFAIERHMSIFSTPAQGDVDYRFFTAFIPHDKNLWATTSDLALRASRFLLWDVGTDGTGDVRVDFNFRAGAEVIDLLKPAGKNVPIIRSNQNNRAMFQQMNAAGNAFLPLPYINGRNELELNNTAFYFSSPAATSIVGLKSSFTHLHLSPAANDVVRYATANGAVTGNITGERFDMTATGDAKMDYRNLGSGKIVIDLVAATGGGELRVNGVKVVGARNTGWTAMTGTASKGAMAAAAAGTASATYTQSEMQGALGRIAAIEARLKAHDDALFAHGLIGA